MNLVAHDEYHVHAGGDVRQQPSATEVLGDEVVVLAANGSKYRRSVCVFIMNGEGLFLGCRRCDDRNALQCVQGGAKAGETVRQTADREVWEEIGLPATHLRFIGEVVPSASGEEPRAQFRYKSKSWRKLGIVGQELYPLLYAADVGVVRMLNFRTVPEVRREFCGAMWVPLEELVRHSVPSKAAAMKNMCMHVAPLARSFLAGGQPLTIPFGDASVPPPHVVVEGGGGGHVGRNNGAPPAEGNTAKRDGCHKRRSRRSKAQQN